MQTIVPNRAKASARQSAFLITPFQNSGANASVSYRVSGSLDGKRVRENYATRQGAEARRTELEALRLGQATKEAIRATWLSQDQLQTAEWAFTRFSECDEVRRAVEFWTTTGKAQHDRTAHASDLRLDDVVLRFNTYLDGAADLRDVSKRDLRYRVRKFAEKVGNVPVAKITTDTIEAFLSRPGLSPGSKHTIRRRLNRFFGWCLERPQHFIALNPVTPIKVALGERAEPECFTLIQTMRILASARRVAGGAFLRFVVLQLFGGLRPTEAIRFRDDQVVNGQFRIEGAQAKTGAPRTNEAEPILLAWLAECPAARFTPARNHDLWKQVAKAAGRPWIYDGLRHTAISFHYQRGKSYGATADVSGNSEAIIKKHYRARVSASDCAKFWTLFPKKSQRVAARKALESVVAFPATATTATVKAA